MQMDVKSIANRSLFDRKINSKNVIACVHFDVVFSGQQIHRDTFSYRQIDLIGLYNWIEISTNGWDFLVFTFFRLTWLQRQAQVSAMFCDHLRWFYDRFDIGLEKNIKATKRHQYDIDQSMRLAENDACQFIWFDDQRIQDTHLGFVSVGGLDIFYGLWSCDILSSKPPSN